MVYLRHLYLDIIFMRCGDVLWSTATTKKYLDRRGILFHLSIWIRSCRIYFKYRSLVKWFNDNNTLKCGKDFFHLIYHWW